MNIRQLLIISMFIAGGYMSSGAEPVTTELIRQRGLVSKENPARLQAVFEKASRGEPITVAAIGGSITAGGLQTKNPENRYVSRVAAWFTKTFPKAKVSFVNAGIGGTNSYYGAMRLQTDILSKKPDLVIVEFAVNNISDRDFSESYEGLLRQLLREPQKIAVIELFFMHRKGDNAQEWQEMLGRHYQIPMVSFRDAWWPELSGGRAVWEDMYADVVHPNDTGHILATEMLISLLEQANKQIPAGGKPPQISTELPPPMISDVFADCEFYRYENVKPVENKGWSRTADNKYWETAAAGGVLELDFTGRVLFLGFDMDKGVESRVKYSIDGGAAQILKAEVKGRPLVSNLTPGKHRVRIELDNKQPAADSTDKIRVWAVGGAGCRP